MDISSPEKSTGGFNKEYDASLSDKMDLNAFEKEEEFVVGSLEYENEMPRDEREVYLNTCYATPSMPLCVANDKGTQSPLKSNSMGSSVPLTSREEMTGDIDPNPSISIVQIKMSDCGIDGEGNTIKDYQKDAVLEADFDAGATAYSFEETQGQNYHLNNPLDQGDNDHYNSVDRESNEKHDEKNTILDEVVNGDGGNLPLNSQPDEIEVNEEMDYKNSNLKSNHVVQVREGCYSNTAPPENDEMVWQQSSLQSPQETQNVSPSPERQLSVSAERFPHKQSPPKSTTFPREEMPSPRKQVPSPQSSRRRYSPSPEKNSSGVDRASSRERSFPSTRRKSPDQASKRESHNRDDSPRKHLSQSPQKRDSPRRRGESPSKSPMRRRHSPRNQRSHRHSRSRSPIAREHNRRSPRKRSPRRRSPTYHSGRRSPGRRWSPPSNRNTGIGKPGKNLYVAGFSYGTTERDLERKFSKFGRVTDVRVVRDRRTGDSRGFGFLSLERDEDADAAIRAVDQAEWNGRIILVEKSKSSSRRN
ncbi:hypothetical protein KSP40_PGU002664 [Platanthera guangdongensis]|uniref:RRM domain-containing protein n=1 Tax=Platanthera guangdongensis TaxID=2320717 RepID=A0ABR2MWV4_9ASPA